MKWYKLFINLFILSSLIVTAQKKTDFETMLSNSLEKLYQDPDAGIKSCKNISIKENQKHEKLIVKSILAEAYALKGNYEESVKISLENVNSKEVWSKNDQLLINLGVMQQFNILGLYEQSEILILPLLKNLEKPSSDKAENIIVAKIYQVHAFNLFLLKKNELALHNLEISNQYFSKIKPDLDIINVENNLLKARILLQKNDFINSESIFNQEINLLNSTKNNNYLLALALENKSRLNFQKQDYSAAIDSLLQALKTVDSKDFLALKTIIYAGLSKNYLAQKDINKHEEYQLKYDESKTILDENRKAAIRNLMQLSQEYQTQNFKNYIHKKQQELYISIGAAVIILSVFGFLYYQETQKKKTLSKQVLFFENQEKLMTKTLEKPESIKVISKKQLLIPKEKEEELLQKLQAFEESELFIDKNMSLALLASHLETNTKYLSEIINKYKDKNFTAYINELKINHIAYLISTNPTYRQYKISYLAEISGFTSHSTFTIVFKSITGMSPNDYIQQVRKRKII